MKLFYLKCINIEVKEWHDKSVQSYLLAWNLHLKKKSCLVLYFKKKKSLVWFFRI